MWVWACPINPYTNLHDIYITEQNTYISDVSGTVKQPRCSSTSYKPWEQLLLHAWFIWVNQSWWSLWCAEFMTEYCGTGGWRWWNTICHASIVQVSNLETIWTREFIKLRILFLCALSGQTCRIWTWGILFKYLFAQFLDNWCVASCLPFSFYLGPQIRSALVTFHHF